MGGNTGKACIWKEAHARTDRLLRKRKTMVLPPNVSGLEHISNSYQNRAHSKSKPRTGKAHESLHSWRQACSTRNGLAVSPKSHHHETSTSTPGERKIHRRIIHLNQKWRNMSTAEEQ